MSSTDVEVTVHGCVTQYQENFTVEYKPSEAQIRRAREVRNEWVYSRRDVRISAEEMALGVDELTRRISSHIDAPTRSNNGELISNQIFRINTPGEIQPDPLEDIAAWRFEARRLMELAKEFKDGEEYVLEPWLRAGGLDPWTIFSSVAAANQLILMIIDMWLRGNSSSGKKGDRTPEPKTDASCQSSPVEKINVMMSDGSWIHVDWWVHSPKALRSFVNRFREGARVQPQKVVFFLQDGEEVTLEVSTKTDRKQLGKFMALLGLQNG